MAHLLNLIFVLWHDKTNGKSNLIYEIAVRMYYKNVACLYHKRKGQELLLVPLYIAPNLKNEFRETG